MILQIQLEEASALLGFSKENLDWIFSETFELCSGESISQYDVAKGGIEVWPGVDLGYCGPEIFEEVIRPCLTKRSWKNIMRKGLGLTGEKAESYLLEHSTMISQIPDLSVSALEFFEISMEKITSIYWNRLLKINPNISNAQVDIFSKPHEYSREDLIEPCCQAAVLFLWIRNPSIPVRIMKTICTTEYLTSKMALAVKLKNLESFGYRNIGNVINFLLQDHFGLTDSVGLGGANSPEDILSVAERLYALDFLDTEEFQMNGTEVDWTPLNNFIEVIGFGEVVSELVTPGGLVHLWLCSKSAPRKIEFSSTAIETSPVLVCSWFTETIQFLAKKQRLNAIRDFQKGEEYEVKQFAVHSIEKSGMAFKIKLPSKNSTDCLNCDDPNLDLEYLESLCKDLLKSKYISGHLNVKLKHHGLAEKGLTCYSDASSGYDNLLIELSQPPLYFSNSNEAEKKPFTLESEGTLLEIDSSSDNVYSDEELYDFYTNIIQMKSVNTTLNFDSVNELHLLGITGWLNEKSVTNKKNEYNDTILALWKNIDGNKIVKKYTATTAPGTFSKLYNSKGDAHLVNGRYAYKKGKHNGYDALVQAEEFTVWRDPEKSGVRYENSLVESGWFGINLHAGGISKEVSNWSAGCQVIWGGRDVDSPFLEFMQNVNSLLDDDEVVYYTLVDSREIPSLSDYYSVGGDD